MSENFEIRKLTGNDVMLAKELFHFFQVDDGRENPTAASEDYLRNLLRKDDFHVLIALENGNIAGGLTAYEVKKYKNETTEMFLYEISVGNANRRGGVASALIEKLKMICAEKNIRVMFVLAEADNQPAIGLYRKTGGQGFDVVEFDYEFE